MSKVEDYREHLKTLDDWRPFLLQNSGLPGPRGNLELAEAFADLAGREQADAFLAIPVEDAPENSAEVFLVFCGITALGKRIAEGDSKPLHTLRRFASDPRWRVREAVAIALQYVGDADMKALLAVLREWSAGNWYEKRAAAAAIAEPRLLRDPASARAALKIFNNITRDMAAGTDPRDETFKVLRQTMGYCWSVGVAALPGEGKALMEKWLKSSDPDVLWIMKENLKKKRLLKIDPGWVKRSQRALNVGE
jgi:HEAT repeats